MHTYFLIDSTNNNKVLKEFDSISDGNKFLDNKETTENWEENYETFQEFKDEFFFIASDEMQEAISKSGNRKKDYWN